VSVAQIIGSVLAIGFFVGLVVAVLLARRLLSATVGVTESRQPFTAAGVEFTVTDGRPVHTFECWRRMEDPGETCGCKPWSRES
jgi:hypothetical protein